MSSEVLFHLSAERCIVLVCFSKNVLEAEAVQRCNIVVPIVDGFLTGDDTPEVLILLSLDVSAALRPGLEGSRILPLNEVSSSIAAVFAGLVMYTAAGFSDTITSSSCAGVMAQEMTLSVP